MQFTSNTLTSLVLVILFNLNIITRRIECATHWQITDSGRIETKDDSPFALLRPYDLAAFMKQVDRVERLDKLKMLINVQELANKRDLTTSKTSSSSTLSSVSSFQENFYKTDQDCLRAGQQLNKFNFYEFHYFSSWYNRMETYLPEIVLNLEINKIKVYEKPLCDKLTELPFSMRTFDHLESIQSKHLISMAPEIELLTTLGNVESVEFYGHLIHQALLVNKTSWIYLTMAAEFFRIKGDFANTIKCYQRAIFYANNKHVNVPILGLSKMLHKHNFLNDSLSLALSSLTFEPINSAFAYHIANIYVTLSDLNLAFNWYDKAYALDKSLKQAYLKKHAVLCHLKLEQYLEEQHANLQKRLDELKDYQAYSEEWFDLNAKIDMEKSSANRKYHTIEFYKRFLNEFKSKICTWNRASTNKIKLECYDLPHHYSINYEQVLFNSTRKKSKNFDHASAVRESNFLACKNANSKDCSQFLVHISEEPDSLDEYFVSNSIAKHPYRHHQHEKSNCHEDKTKSQIYSQDSSTSTDQDDLNDPVLFDLTDTSHEMRKQLLHEKRLSNRIKIPDYISIF